MVRLLISTHSRVLLFDTETRTSEILHSGEGVYYGLAYPWVVSRKKDECLLNMINNVKVPLPSLFTHDITRDGSRILVADCDGGGVVEVSTETMSVTRHVRPFTKKNHVNTIAVQDGDVWCLLHNLGPSLLVKIDMETGECLEQVTNVGTQSHGLVWRDRNFLILDSYNGALIHGGETIWKSPERRFLKGLCVDGDTAYFGVSEITERSNRGSPDLQCELAAVDLITGDLIWREKLQTCGLLNAIQKYY
jgi:hypothetical protein